MGKKKEAKAQKRERFMVQLPEWHRNPLAKLKDKYRRPTTAEVEIALEKHYKDEGLPSAPRAG